MQKLGRRKLIGALADRMDTLATNLETIPPRYSVMSYGGLWHVYNVNLGYTKPIKSFEREQEAYEFKLSLK